MGHHCTIRCLGSETRCGPNNAFRLSCTFIKIFGFASIHLSFVSHSTCRVTSWVRMLERSVWFEVFLLRPGLKIFLKLIVGVIKVLVVDLRLILVS